ncbi:MULTISPECIES: ROK family transcriptional regulator [Paracoccaceae]|jgi:predicted NBD/HSP70 family sugar kinase|uniref:ROK family transcriptional regulator n=1 Tax=Rhodobacterales TaxID=204455 RepID=UPI001B163A8C|nr:ROK family transcriptional regulator [Boseongicola sp. H5]MBO6603641.1 ROK family transcriptional regulator [Roseicyclus sp.]MBO6626266.1 ROK family transcriptional regulator [Roseicyclus sp.]MBO6923951.1 ROK family transcriptional regulator [Roseicyclus sp.]
MSLPLLPPGSNAERSRAYNRGLVLGHVRRAGASGRAEIARASGLSTQAVSNIIGELVAEGWLYEAGRRTGGRGLPAVTYAIDGAAGTAFGIELRPNAVLCALIDLDGRALYTDRVAVSRADPGHVVQLVSQLLERALSNSRTKVARVLGAGVVMPGPFGKTGLSGFLTELPGWEGLDAQALFAEVLDMAVTVENDANAAAMAERVSGVAAGLSSYAFLYFGTGIGLGLVSGGTIFRGAFGNAGEIGHVPAPFEGGLKPLEEIASRMALTTALRRAGEAAETVTDLDRLFEQRHPAMMAWIEGARPALSHAVHIVENLYDPEAVIMGGALPARLLQHLTDTIPLPSLSVSNRADRNCPRLLAGTAGRMTATHGAAALVINQTLTPSLGLAT